MVFLLMLLTLTGTQVQRVNYVKDKLGERGFSQKEIQALFDQERLKIYPPVKLSKTWSWKTFTTELLKPGSVARGKQFVEKNLSVLTEAQKEYGVEKETITAILRIETDFGENLGKYEVFNVFYTNLLKARDGLKDIQVKKSGKTETVKVKVERWKWHAENLVAFAAYCRASGKDCFGFLGSYAGAFGLPQFLPVSVVNFGVDADNDGKVDLYQIHDAIDSAANFLKAHGWKQNQRLALARYYGSEIGYPDAAILYARALGTKK